MAAGCHLGNFKWISLGRVNGTSRSSDLCYGQCVQWRFYGAGQLPRPLPLSELWSPVRPNRRKNWLQDSKVAVFTAWNRIAGVKLHHSLNHTLSHPEFLPPSPNAGVATPLATPNCCSQKRPWMCRWLVMMKRRSSETSKQSLLCVFEQRRVGMMLIYYVLISCGSWRA